MLKTPRDSGSLCQLDQYMALSKKDLQIQITLNELYNTHSLLAQHVDVLVRQLLTRDRLRLRPVSQ